MHACRLYQILAYGDKPPLKDRGQSHVTRLSKILPYHIFVIGEARHFKFRVLTDTEEYECMHDILLPKWMYSESRDLF